MLWVQGKPASGKSTLVKYFREHIIPSTSSTFCIVADFFYSHRGGELGKSHTVMLQSLLYQILDQAGSFFECFLDEYRLLRRQHGAGFKWPEASLKRILLSLVTHQMVIETTVHLYIIIDALDESNEEGRRSILDIFRQISSTKGPVVVTKVLMASRPNVEVEDILRDCHLIRLQDENRDDIGAFVSYYLKDVYDDLHFEEQEYLNAKEYIVENSQGVFLWTHFVVQELAEKARRGLSRREIRQTLESLPFELYGVYERIIRELLAEEDDGEIQKSEKMFQLVLFAARPLTVAEFSQAMAVPANYFPHVFTEEDLEDNLIRPTIKRPVLCRGRNLIETSYHVKVDELFPRSLVHAVADSDEHDIGIVQLMHHSAREFLLRPNGYMKETKRFNLRDRACHGVLAIICLRYLQLIAEKLIKTAPHAGFLDNDADINGWCDADIKAFVTYLGEKRFFRYALEYLPWHMDRTGIDVESGRIARELYHKLFVNMNEPSFRHMRCIFRHSFSKRHIPVGCSIWVDRKSSMIHDEDPPIAFNEGLIITAAQARKVDVVLALVHTAATNDPKSFTVLLSLAALGNEQALRLFLENGPVTDINETGGEHGNVLNLAAYLGHMSIVRVLLERGAEINAVSPEYGNVVEAAAAGAGSEEVVRLLIDAGADLDAEPGLYGTAVEVATYHGHQRVVNLLVNRGAIVVGKTAMFFGNGWGGGAWTRSTRAPEFSESPIGIDYRRTRIRCTPYSQVN